MPYFTSIGSIPGNVFGVGARGYFLRRSGSKVIVKWGAIGITRTLPRIFYWVGPNLPRTKTHRCGTPKRAEHRVRTLKKQKLLHSANHEWHNYTKLPVGKTIRRYSAKLAARS
jgi:hypothetical protein